VLQLRVNEFEIDNEFFSFTDKLTSTRWWRKGRRTRK